MQKGYLTEGKNYNILVHKIRWNPSIKLTVNKIKKITVLYNSEIALKYNHLH